MNLEPGKLTWSTALSLAPKIRPEDVLECEGDPFAALTGAFQAGGDYWTAIRDDTGEVIGAYGWTDAGRIWSLWKSLSLIEAKEVLRHTPLWVSQMVEASGRDFLHNFVDCDNSPAIKWLEASRCFHINRQPFHLNGSSRRAYGFRTKLTGVHP